MRSATLIPALGAVIAALAAASVSAAETPVAQTAPPPPACALAPTTNKVLVGGSARRARRGTVTLTAMCSQFVNATVTGRVTELAVRGHRRRRDTLAPVQRYVPANTATSLTVKLPARAIAALEAGRPESATFTLTAVDEHGTASAGVTLGRLKPLR
jgi:hypothetical protein